MATLAIKLWLRAHPVLRPRHPEHFWCLRHFVECSVSLPRLQIGARKVSTPLLTPHLPHV